mgnify:CR=1 FL=1
MKRKLRSNFPRGSYLWAVRNAHWHALGIPEEDCEKPKIAIINTSSELAACFSHLDGVAAELKQAIREAGGVPFEVRTTAPSDFITGAGARGAYILSARDLVTNDIEASVEGAMLDGMVCLTSCDKTVPGQLMAAARLNIPSLMVSCGYQPSGEYRGRHVDIEDVFVGAMHVVTGNLDREELIGMSREAVKGPGVCSGMGTANSMHIVCEALGMALPGSTPVAANSARMRDAVRQAGQRIVEMVWEDLRPLDILTREAFENAIVTCSGLGGSSNAPVHINAIARHAGIELTNDDWQRLGYEVPLLANVMPAGAYLCEEFYRAGGVPAVLHELLAAGKIHGDVLTVNGQTLAANLQGHETQDAEVIRRFDNPLVEHAGFLNLKGNLFDSALMKTSVISPDFRARFLSDPDDPEAFEGKVAVFDGSEDYHARIDDPQLGIDERTILVMRGAGPVGHPGGAEVVNMQPPAALLQRGIESLPCLGDGRQSGTSGSPSILNAAPEAATGGGLALLEDGDRLRVDLRRGEVRLLLDDAEIAVRRQRLEARGGYIYPDHQTPWQEIQRSMVEPLDRGMTLEPATKYRDVARRHPPRDNH